MIKKIIAVIFLAFLVSACQATNSKQADKTNTNSIANRYNVESQSLEAFTPIKNSKINARASDRVFFDFDSASLDSAARATLDKQAKWLKSHSSATITIEGHCDERGTREYNLALGDRRANSVKRYLASAGVAASKISVVSYGKERPAVLGSNSSAWAENRRGVTTLN